MGIRETGELQHPGLSVSTAKCKHHHTCMSDIMCSVHSTLFAKSVVAKLALASRNVISLSKLHDSSFRDRA